MPKSTYKGLRIFNRRWVALLLLIAVVAIFVSPAFDIPDSALRAKGLAQRIALMLIALASLLSGFVLIRFVTAGFVLQDGHPRGSAPPLGSVLPLLC